MKLPTLDPILGDDPSVLLLVCMVSVCVQVVFSLPEQTKHRLVAFPVPFRGSMSQPCLVPQNEVEIVLALGPSM